MVIEGDWRMLRTGLFYVGLVVALSVLGIASWASFLLAILLGVLLGHIQTEVAMRPATFDAVRFQGETRSASAEGLTTVWITEYQEARAARHGASQNAMTLFQYFQLLASVAVVLVLTDFGIKLLGLDQMNHDLRGVLLALVAFLLSAVAADIQHWRYDIQGYDDYVERYLRPALSAVCEWPVLRLDESRRGGRPAENLRWRNLLNLQARMLFDNNRLSILGQGVFLGLSGLLATAYSFHLVRQPALLIFVTVIGLYAFAVWTSFCRDWFQYVLWQRDLRLLWASGSASPRSGPST